MAVVQLPCASLVLLLSLLLRGTDAQSGSGSCGPITPNSNTIQQGATSSTYPSGTTVTMGCTSGYFPDTGTSATATCSGNGNNVQWNWGSGQTQQLTCSQGCSAITLKNNTYQSTPATAAAYAVGTTVTLACTTSSLPDSLTDTTGTCTTSTTGPYWAWNAGTTQLSCTQGCSAPVLTSPVQSTASATAYAVGSTVSLTCASGYTPNSGSNILTCGSDYTWQSPTTPFVCLKDCGPITVNSNTTQTLPASATSYAPGTAATLTCLSNTIAMIGTSGSGLCSNGAWSWGNPGDEQLKCFKGCNSPVTTGMTLTPSQATYLIGDQINVTCSTGFVNVSGSGRATCNATGLWLWQGSGQALTCVQTCAFPEAVTGRSYVSSSTVTYKLNDTITAQCASGYSNSSGSNAATCSVGGVWTWRDPGPLICLQKCTTLPILTAGSMFVSSQTAIYMVGNTLTIDCQGNYTYLSGNKQAICGANNTWSWSGSQLQCTPTCLPPTPGAYASISTDTMKTLYVFNDVVTFQCASGYMYDSGANTGTCTNPNTWTWSGAATPLICIVIPKFLASNASVFAPGTCQNYGLRPATTDGTCMMSCTYDGYCTGYALTSGGCYHDRPQLTSNTTTMACQVRRL